MSDQGTCGFCGYGDGYLLEQGNETSKVMHSTVKTIGDDGQATYERHPNAWDSNNQYITWCGHCLGGLKHRYQRLDDHNLAVQLRIYQLWDQMDGLRWAAAWDMEGTGSNAPHLLADDPATHIDKLNRHDEIPHMRAEMARRAGYRDLVAEGWRE